MSNRTVKDIERELYMAQFKVKRCIHMDHLYDMEKWECEVELLKEELEKVKQNEKENNIY